MPPKLTVKTIPCPDSECVDGLILVNNAYSSDPLIGSPQKCDTCHGNGYLVQESISNN